MREDTQALRPESLPSKDTILTLWNQLKGTAVTEGTTLFETSSMMAVSAMRSVPEHARWLSATAGVAAARTGQVFATALLDHYRETLAEIQRTGYLAYTTDQLRPYVHAAAKQFSPEHRTLTERLLEKIEARRNAP